MLCKEFFIAAPLVGQLHSDTMRRRHWDELVQATGKEIDLPFKHVEGSSSKFGEGTALNEDLLVGDILKLDLHKVRTDVLFGVLAFGCTPCPHRVWRRAWAIRS